MVLFHYIFVCSTMYHTYRISCFSSLIFTVCQLLFIVFMLSYSVNVSVCSVGKMFTHFILGALRSSPYGVGVCSLFKAVLRPLFVLIWQYTCCWVFTPYLFLFQLNCVWWSLPVVCLCESKEEKDWTEKVNLHE
jgi:hypothetical protein